MKPRYLIVADEKGKFWVGKPNWDNNSVMLRKGNWRLIRLAHCESIDDIYHVDDFDHVDYHLQTKSGTMGLWF